MNGTAKAEAKEVVKAPEIENPMKVVKGNDEQAEQAPPLPREQRPPVTAAQRIEKMELMRKLAAKYDFLKVKDGDLKKFMIGSDGMNEKLVLKSATQEIELNNSAVIRKVIDLVSGELSGILKEAEKELVSFEI